MFRSQADVSTPQCPHFWISIPKTRCNQLLRPRHPRRWTGAAALPRRAALWNGNSRDDLLLEVARVAAVVIGADRRHVVGCSAGRVAEVVPDERRVALAHAEPQGRVQLRVPRVGAQAD